MRPAAPILLGLLGVVALWTLFRGGPAAPEAVPPPARKETPAPAAPGALLAAPPGERRPGTEERPAARTVEGPATPDDDFPLEEVELDDAELLARAGLPPDTPLALRIGRWGPPDPRETGEAVLHLALRERASGEPVDSVVVLWRLDAPANAYWTRGDQDVAEAWIQRGGGEIAGLAAGEYRAVCLEERAGAPHQQPFFVSGRTSVELLLDLPSARPARLRLVGREPPLPRIEARFQPMAVAPVEWRVPPWIRPREIQRGWDDLIVAESLDSSTSSDGEPAWVRLFETPLGFDLGTFPGDARGRRHQQRVDLRTDDGWTGTVVLTNAPAGEVLTVTADLDPGARGD